MSKIVAKDLVAAQNWKTDCLELIVAELEYLKQENYWIAVMAETGLFAILCMPMEGLYLRSFVGNCEGKTTFFLCYLFVEPVNEDGEKTFSCLSSNQVLWQRCLCIIDRRKSGISE
ncbi:uncharacterized protein [Montipora capricornis]|uniref:uncharacterized protein isoform X2 n=1 Tax=Montipora capricornis TaxID=246305 RepID=UPI0035F18F78